MTDRREFQRPVPRGESEIRYALKWAEAMLRDWLMTHEEAALIVTEPRRTLDQNSKLWPMLEDFSRQVEWFVDGAKRKMTKWEWKDVFTAALKKHHIAQGIDGGFVVIGAHTSRMTKGELSELIELIYSEGAARKVEWSEPAKKTIEEHKARKAGHERARHGRHMDAALGASTVLASRAE